VARIVLDTDVVSLYRSGRLPAGFGRRVAANDLSIAFATAGSCGRGRWPDDGAAPAAAASTCGSTRQPSFPPA
jgi:hypothetical protein